MALKVLANRAKRKYKHKLLCYWIGNIPWPRPEEIDEDFIEDAVEHKCGRCNYYLIKFKLCRFRQLLDNTKTRHIVFVKILSYYYKNRHCGLSPMMGHTNDIHKIMKKAFNPSWKSFNKNAGFHRCLFETNKVFQEIVVFESLVNKKDPDWAHNAALFHTRKTNKTMVIDIDCYSKPIRNQYEEFMIEMNWDPKKAEYLYLDSNNEEDFEHICQSFSVLFVTSAVEMMVGNDVSCLSHYDLKRLAVYLLDEIFK